MNVLKHNFWWAVVAAALAFSGCGGTQDGASGDKNGGTSTGGSETTGTASGGSDGGKLTIGMMPKVVGIDYFNAVESGAREAAKEIGAELVWDGPSDPDVTKQAEMLDAWIARKVNVIAVAPNDPNALAPTLKKALERGIKVISYDSDSNEESRSVFVNQATAESIGSGLVDIMAEQIGNKGEVAIVTGSMTADNQNTWMKYMEQRASEKYPEMKIVTVKPAEESQELAVQVTQDLLKAYPNLKGVFGITSVALPGAALAVQKAGMTGKVAVTGLSTPKSMKDFVADGTVKEFLLWSPVDLGYLTVHAGAAVAKNEKLGESVKAGRLGDKVVSGTQVLLGDPVRFNKDNIGNYNF